MKILLVISSLVALIFSNDLNGQVSINKLRAQINRNDNRNIVFNIEEVRNGKQLSWVIKNAEERIAVKEFKESKDSLNVSLPFLGQKYF